MAAQPPLKFPAAVVVWPDGQLAGHLRAQAGLVYGAVVSGPQFVGGLCVVLLAGGLYFAGLGGLGYAKAIILSALVVF